MDIQNFLCFSTTWYTVVLIACFTYFFFAVLSAIFTRESGFLKYSSIFHDNLVISLALLAVFQRILSTRIAIPLEFHALTKNRRWEMLTTCELTSYCHFFLQLNFIFSLYGVFYSLPLKITSNTPISKFISNENLKEKSKNGVFHSQRLLTLVNKMADKFWCSLQRVLGKICQSKSSRYIQSQAKVVILLQWTLAVCCSLVFACKNVFTFPKTIFLCCFKPINVGVGTKVFFASTLVANVFTIVVIVWLTKNRILRMVVTANRLHISSTMRSGFTIWKTWISWKICWESKPRGNRVLIFRILLS